MELSPLVSSEDHSNNIGFVQGQAVALFNGDSFAVSIEDGDTVNLLTHDGRKFKHAIDMLVQAFNNRTRQRNYFRLYCDLLDGQLSDEDFDAVCQELPHTESETLFNPQIYNKLRKSNFVTRLNFCHTCA